MNIISFFHQNISPDLLTFYSIFIFAIIILLMLKFFTKEGLQIYISIAFIACNIQVMKGSMFFFQMSQYLLEH
jgi:hypothetical protein